MKSFKQHMSNMKTLFVQRKLLNADELREWALEQGFKTTVPLDEMHVTCAFSKKKVDWNKLRLNQVNVSIPGEHSTRKVQVLGDKGAVVLKFTSAILTTQWQKIIDAGASWDYPDYQPHVTITYEGKGIKPEKMEPYDGDLVFGPQIHTEVDKNFVTKLKEI